MTFYLYDYKTLALRRHVTYDSEGIEIIYHEAALLSPELFHEKGARHIATIERDIPSNDHLGDIQLLKSMNDREFVDSMTIQVLLAELKDLGRHDIVEVYYPNERSRSSSSVSCTTEKNIH